jgi:glycogen debranching enzyme
MPLTLRRRLVSVLFGERWAGHPTLKFPLPPSTSPCSSAYNPTCYWRGPVWPVFTWLLAWSLWRSGERAAASALRGASLAQLDDAKFGEYYHPVTGEPLGSLNQSWTAAVALDWLLDEE